MNELLGPIAIRPVEELLNRILAKDSYLRSRLKIFSGKSLQISVYPPGITVTVLFERDRIRLLSSPAELLDIEITASISGNVSELIPLLIEKPDRRPLSNPAITVTGDVNFIQDIYASLHNLDIDWEDYLAPMLGNLITNELSQFGEDLQEWSQQVSSNMRRNVDEYLKEEERIFPKKEQLRDFSEELERLKLKIDRVKAKFNVLYERLDRLNNT